MKPSLIQPYLTFLDLINNIPCPSYATDSGSFGLPGTIFPEAFSPFLLVKWHIKAYHITIFMDQKSWVVPLVQIFYSHALVIVLTWFVCWPCSSCYCCSSSCWTCWTFSQFQQHFMSCFCTNILFPNNYKAEFQAQRSFAKLLFTKKAAC